MQMGHRPGRMELGESSRGGRQRRQRGERRESKSVRAGVHFPVGRIRRYLKNGRYAKQVRWPAAIFKAAVIEYVVGEVFPGLCFKVDLNIIHYDLFLVKILNSHS